MRHLQLSFKKEIQVLIFLILMPNVVVWFLL